MLQLKVPLPYPDEVCAERMDQKTISTWMFTDKYAVKMVRCPCSLLTGRLVDQQNIQTWMHKWEKSRACKEQMGPWGLGL